MNREIFELKVTRYHRRVRRERGGEFRMGGERTGLGGKWGGRWIYRGGRGLERRRRYRGDWDLLFYLKCRSFC